MIRINYISQVKNFAIFLLLQIPILYRLVFFDKAFGFFYVGFLLLLPFGISRSLAMLIGLGSGLIIDVFSNTPGIHAAACVLLAFIKDLWYNVANEHSDDDVELTVNAVGIWGFTKYAFPLIFIHHCIIFIVENGGLSNFWLIAGKIFYSAILSFIIILTIGYLLSPRKQRI
ncbi:MAG: hypothetical protein ACFHWX_19185 [Bacteroidota bacterium]